METWDLFLYKENNKKLEKEYQYGKIMQNVVN